MRDIADRMAGGVGPDRQLEANDRMEASEVIHRHSRDKPALDPADR